MTGPEHYLEAESLLGSAVEAEGGSADERYLLAAAQVHATLASAAATALGTGGAPVDDWREWRLAAGRVKPQAPEQEEGQ